MCTLNMCFLLKIDTLIQDEVENGPPAGPPAATKVAVRIQRFLFCVTLGLSVKMDTVNFTNFENTSLLWPLNKEGTVVNSG